MEFPPRVLYPRRFHSSPATSPDLRSKLATLVDRNKKLKLSYRQLQSQIAYGLVEAGEVFDSLAIPLMKLVGIKTSEMENEGRESTFTFNTERYHTDTTSNRARYDHTNNQIRSATERYHTDTTRNRARYDHTNNQIRSATEENYAAKAESAGNEILRKHKGQLRQLVHMLKHIETQVNAHQDDIVEMIDKRRTFFQEFIQKALYYLSSVHSQNHDTFPATVKLLRAIFDNIKKVLGSVDSGVNDLMQALAKNMCSPMTKYVGNLAAEIKVGPCVQLMNILNEMEKSNKDTRRELEDARERIRIAEETKIDALSRLRKAEEQVQRMTRTSRFLPPACQRKQVEHSINGKRLTIEGNRENEEKLLWDLLSKRRKQQEPESPMGPKELIRQVDTKPKPLVYSRRMTRSQTKFSSPMARPDGLIPLGVSPSVRTATGR